MDKKVSEQYLRFFRQFISKKERIHVVKAHESKDRKHKAINETHTLETIQTITQPENYALYFCPNQIKSGKERNESNLSELRYIFIDIDKGSYKGFKTLSPAPHIVCKRKDNAHIYYRIQPVEATQDNIELYKKIVRAMIRRFNADPTVSNPANIIRIPYTIRWKNGDKDFYKVEHINDSDFFTLYGFEQEFKQEIAQQEIEKSTKNNNVKTDITKNTSSVSLSNFDAAEYIKQRNRQMPVTREGEGRSRRLLAIGYECRDWGLDLDTALALALELNSDIFQPPESISVVKHQVKSAYKYARGEAGARLQEYTTLDGAKEQKKFFKLIKEEERVRARLSKCVYIVSILHLIDTNDGITYSGNDAINSYLRSVINTVLPFSHILRKNLIQTYKKVDFRPDQDKIFRDVSGVLSFNRFKALPVYEETNTKIAREAVKIFLDHIKYLTETPYESETVLQFLAHTLQKPGQKIKYALLFINTQEGTGRSWLADLMSLHLGEYTIGVDHDNIKFGYTQYLVDKLLIFIHEIRDNDRFAFMDRFKSRITEKDILIEEKYSRSYRQTNTVNIIFFSNYRDAVKIEKHDRRLLVMLNEKLPQTEEYYNRLYGVLQNPEAYQAIFSYLLNYDLSKFNPHKRPEITRGKTMMIAANASELQLYLDELRNHPEDNRGSGFETPFINVRSLQRYIEAYGSAQVKNRASEKQLKAYLLEQGYKEERINKRFRGIVVHKTVWLHPDTKIDDDLMEKMIEYFSLAVEENKEIY